MAYTFTAVEVKEKKIAGIHVQTNMEKSVTDCPELWMQFMPLMCDELVQHPAVVQGSPTYGVSQFIDNDRFTYWAAVQVDSSAGLPQGLDVMTIPAGLYVKSTALSLDKLGETFSALDAWMNTQSQYAYNMQGVGFEEYKHGWQMTDSIDVYVAVIKK